MSTPASCDSASQLLLGGNPAEVTAFLDHLALCLPCQVFVARHEQRFVQIFENDPIDEHLPLVQDALDRLAGIESRFAKKPRQEWQAPVIPGYELIDLLSQTSHSKVFRAQQTSLPRQVALKYVILSDKSGGSKVLAGESAVLAGLNHPNILTIYETGTWDRGIWLSLEYCEGGSLAERLQSPWRTEAAAKLTLAIAQAAHAAHKQGVIHRDIKPANILFTREGQGKLGDFGLAAGSDWGSPAHLSPSSNDGKTPLSVVGTSSYIAPEQVCSMRCDHRVDVHGLGAVLYHLLTGCAPFSADSTLKELNLAASEIPLAPAVLNPLVPEDLSCICMKCLAKDPGQRYDTALQMARDLEDFLEGMPVRARPLGQAERVNKWARRNRSLVKALAGLALTMIGSMLALAALSCWALVERQKAMEMAARNELEKKRAESLEKRALKKQAESEAQSYVNKITRAFFEWEFGSAITAWKLLESCPFEFRGWEHDHLTTLLSKNQVILHGHSRNVNGVAVSPDGKRIASTGEDGSVLLWDALTGDLLGKVAESDSPARGLVFSNNGKTLAIALRKRAVLIVNVAEKRVTNTIEIRPEKPIPFSLFGRSICLNREASQVYCELENEGIGVWDTKSGNLARVCRFGKKMDTILSLAITQDGKKIAAGGNATIWIWDTQTGNLVHEIDVPGTNVRCLCFDNAGKSLIAGLNDHSVFVIESANGKLIHKLKSHTDSVQAVALSPNEKILASAGDDYNIKLWDWKTGNLLKTLKGHGNSVSSLSFISPGQGLVSASWDKTLRVWNTQGTVNEPRIVPNDLFRALAFSPVTSLLAFAGFSQGKTGGAGMEVGLWDTFNLNHYHSFYRLNVPFQSIAFSPVHERLSCGAKDGYMATWDAKNKLMLWEAKPTSETIQRIAYSPDGKYIYLAVNLTGQILVVDGNSGALLRTIQAHSSTVIGLAASSDGKWLASGGRDSAIKIWKTADYSLVQTLDGHTEQVRSLAFSRDGSILASGCDAGKIVLWNLKTGTASRVLTGHGEGVTTLRFTRNGDRLFSSSFDKTVRIWNIDSGEELVTLTKHTAAVRETDLNSEGSLLASGGDDGNIILWEANAKMDSQQLQPQSQLIAEAGFQENSPLIFAQTRDGELIAWDPRNGRQVPVNDTELKAPSFGKLKSESPDGKYFVLWKGQDVWLVDKSLRKTIEESNLKKLKSWAETVNYK